MTDNFDDISKSKAKGVFVFSFVLIGLVLFFVFFPSATTVTSNDSTLVAKDDQGNVWELSLSSSPWKQETKGEPLVAKAEVNKSGRVLYLDAVVEGNAGEQYLPAATKNGSMQNAPSYKIYDEAGKVLGSGDFTFG